MPESYQTLPPLGDRPKPDPVVANDVNRLLETISRDRKRIPNLADVVEQLLEQWGGARQFAAAYYTEFKKAPSPTFRGRMLESVLRLMQAYAAVAGPQEEISGLSDDDLRSVVMGLIGPFYAKQKEADARLQRAAADQEAPPAEEKAALQYPGPTEARPAPKSGAGSWYDGDGGLPARDSNSGPCSDR